MTTALEMGYRHIDTAQAYGNETAVGRGITDASVSREAIFLATKIWTDNLGYGDVIHSTKQSLDRLGVSSVDLMYVHWPAGEYDPEDTLSAFGELSDQGLIDRVGVSNFEPPDLAEAVDVADVPIFANQFEMHPLLPQDDLVRACRELDVEPVAYSPLARGNVFDVPEIRSVASANDVSPAQVSLAWLRERGVTAIPKATSEDHIRANWASLALDLDEDLATIDGIERHDRRVDPSFAPW